MASNGSVIGWTRDRRTKIGIRQNIYALISLSNPGASHIHFHISSFCISLSLPSPLPVCPSHSCSCLRTSWEEDGQTGRGSCYRKPLLPTHTAHLSVRPRKKLSSHTCAASRASASALTCKANYCLAIMDTHSTLTHAPFDKTQKGERRRRRNSSALPGTLMLWALQRAKILMKGVVYLEKTYH